MLWGSRASLLNDGRNEYLRIRGEAVLAINRHDGMHVIGHHDERIDLNVVVMSVQGLQFSLSNAPEGTSVQVLLLVAFSRWRVERCFEDQKSEIGLDQYEGRRYRGLKRHLVLSCVSYLFLSRMRQEFGGGKPGADGGPEASPAGRVPQLPGSQLLAGPPPSGPTS